MISLLHFLCRQVQDACPWHSAQVLSHGFAALTVTTARGHPGICCLTHKISTSLPSWDHQCLLILSFLPFLQWDGFHLHTTDRTTRLLLLPHCFSAPSTKAHRNKTLQWKNQARDETLCPHIQRPPVAIVMVTYGKKKQNLLFTGVLLAFMTRKTGTKTWAVFQ